MNKDDFRKLRGDLNLTQKEMGERLGIGRRMVVYIESGTRQPSRTIILLAEQLRRALTPHPS